MIKKNIECNSTVAWEKIITQMQIKTDPAIILDVRTKSEWSEVGVPLLPVSMTDNFAAISWRISPLMERNENFLSSVNDFFDNKKFDKRKTTIYVLCRSGIRSLEAAEELRLAGYKNSFSLSGGVDGGISQQSGEAVAGWKACGLPWGKYHE